MRWLLIVFVVSVAAVPQGTTRADQNSPMLDPLFDKLQHVTDPAEAAPIEHRIWKIWGLPDNRSASVPFVQGVLAMNDGKLKAARASFDKVVKIAPDFAEGWNKRATVAYYQGDLEASIKDIQKTVTLEPRHFGALSGLALIHRSLGNDEAALDVLIKVKEIYPGMPGIDERMREIRDALDKKKT